MTSRVRLAVLVAAVAGVVALTGGDARAFTQTAAGYVCTDSEEAGGPAFAWDDISTTGTLVSFAPDGDEGTAAATLPFSFTFGGTAYTSVNIMSNGFLTFGAAPTTYYWSNGALTATTAPSNAIYGFWDDLDQLAAGQVRTQSLGAGATQRFVVSWIGVPRYLETSSITFQIALFANGTIRIQYGTMTGTLTSCTVGVKTTVPNQYNANNTTTTNNVYANLVVQFAPPGAPPPPPPPPGGGTPAAGDDDDDRSRAEEIKDEMCGGSAAASGGLGAMAVALLGALALLRRR